MSEPYPRILIAGATGYLGSFIVRELLDNKTDFFALVRSKNKLTQFGVPNSRIKLAQVTSAESLQGCCKDIDVVISCVGITRQKDGLSFMDVDFQANLNLLEEAERSGVKKFIYVSAFNAQKYKHVRLLKAKECFSERLLKSEKLTPCVIRPNGFFSDIKEFYSMAKAGRAYVFGRGDIRFNPIHGKDLAQFCLEAINAEGRELDIGGPDVLSVSDIAKLAFQAQDKHPKITALPDWVRKLSLLIAKNMSEKKFGSAEFFLTTMAQDMIAPTYGSRHLSDFFRNLYNEESK